jgi:hypothetical protein
MELMMNPFDFVNAINTSKQQLIVDAQSEKDYNPYMVNRSLSYFMDTILFANEMNVAHHIDNKPQFDFLLNAIPKAKRFSKWAKAIEPADLEIVKEYYGYSNDKAKSALLILSKTELDNMRIRLNKGGRTSRR